MDFSKDYYETLGVSRGVEPEALKAVFRALAKKYHPDTTSSTTTSEKFREIQEAFDVLNDPALRADYDSGRFENISAVKNEKAKQEKAKQENARQDKAKQENARQENARQENARQDKARQENAAARESGKQRSFVGLPVKLLMVIFLAIGVAGLYFLQSMVVGMVPATGPIYEMIGLELPLGEGLEISEVAPERGAEAGVDFIIVKGKITNMTGAEKSIPLIKALLVDAGGEEIQSVIQEPAAPMIAGGDTQAFAVKIEKPSPLARSLEVTFVAREHQPTSIGGLSQTSNPNRSLAYPLTLTQKRELVDQLFTKLQHTNKTGSPEHFSYPHKVRLVSGVPDKYKISASSFLRKLISDAVEFYDDNFAKYSGEYDIEISIKTAVVSLVGAQPDALFIEFHAPGFCGSGGCSTHLIFNNGNAWYEVSGNLRVGDLTIIDERTNGFRNMIYKFTSGGEVHRYKYEYDGHRYVSY